MIKEIQMSANTLFPIFFWVFGIGVSVLQLYVALRVAKIKEEVLTIMRREMKEIESKMITTDDLKVFQDNIILRLENLRLELKAEIRKND
jgi:hypothetical protein